MQMLVTSVVLMLLLIHCNQVPGELTVTATISDESAVVAIGFGEFVASLYSDPIEVSCQVDQLPVNGILTLFQDDRNLEVTETSALDRNIDLSAIDLKDNSDRRIIFTCQLRVTRATSGEDRENYIVENSVSLKLLAYEEPFNTCYSSIGTSGTPHESSDLFCATSFPSGRLMWSDQDAFTPDVYDGYLRYISTSVEVSMLSDPMVCRRRSGGEWSEVCTLPEFEIISEPTVSVSPETFPGSADSVSFTCQSNPPSRIRWAIVGDYGYILDDDFIENPPDGEWTVHIEEIAGTSTITLAGGAVPFLNITTVICVTYGRQYTEIGAAWRETNPDATESATANSMKTNNNTSYIIVITILAVSTLILAVSCTILYLRYKGTSEPTKTPGSDNLETINSGYESYQPPAAGAAPYMEVKPSVQNTNIYQEGPVDEEYQLPRLKA